MIVLDPDNRDALIVEEAGNRFFKVSHAPNGGRHVMGGPIDPTPYCFVFPCAMVISSDGEGMADWRDAPRVTVGEIVDVLGYGQRRVEFDSRYGYVDRYNLQLVEV